MMSMTYAAIMNMVPCKTVRYLSFGSGAAVAYLGLDTQFAQFGAGKGMHYLLAGLAPEAVVRMQSSAGLPLDWEGACAAAYGYAGAMAVPMVITVARRVGLA